MDSGAVIETLQRGFHEAKIRQRESRLSVSGQSVIIERSRVSDDDRGASSTSRSNGRPSSTSRSTSRTCTSTLSASRPRPTESMTCRPRSPAAERGVPRRTSPSLCGSFYLQTLIDAVPISTPTSFVLPHDASKPTHTKACRKNCGIRGPPIAKKPGTRRPAPRHNGTESETAEDSPHAPPRQRAAPFSHK